MVFGVTYPTIKKHQIQLNSHTDPVPTTLTCMHVTITCHAQNDYSLQLVSYHRTRCINMLLKKLRRFYHFLRLSISRKRPSHHRKRATASVRQLLSDAHFEFCLFLPISTSSLMLVPSQLMNMNKAVTVDDENKFCFPEETHLTVRKTSVFFPGDGFVAYDPHGKILFRFDSYGPDSKPKDELVLMDAAGKCLLTLLRKVSPRSFPPFSQLLWD